MNRRMTTKQRQGRTISATLELERRNFLILIVAGGLALAAAMGLADMAGYGRLVDAVQDIVPTYFAVVVFQAGLLAGWTIATVYVSGLGVAFYLRFKSGRWKTLRVIEHVPRPPAPAVPGPGGPEV